jgi:hypothetical protein
MPYLFLYYKAETSTNIETSEINIKTGTSKNKYGINMVRRWTITGIEKPPELCSKKAQASQVN